MLNLLLLFALGQDPLPEGALARLRLDPREKGAALGAAAWSSDGTRLAAGSGSGSLRIWNTDGWQAEIVLDALQSPVYALAFSPDGLLLASGHGLDPECDDREVMGPKDTVVRVWNRVTAAETLRLEHRGANVRALAFSPDGATLASGDSRGEVRLWELPAGRLRAAMQTRVNFVAALQVSGDGRRLASAAAWTGRTAFCSSQDPKPALMGNVQVWDLATGAPLQDFPHKELAYSGVHLSGDGSSVSAFAAGDLRSWDVKSGAAGPVSRLGGKGPAALSRDGARVALAAGVGAVQVRATADGRLLRTFQTPFSSVFSFAFAADGRRLFSGHANGVGFVWDLSALK